MARHFSCCRVVRGLDETEEGFFNRVTTQINDLESAGYYTQSICHEGIARVHIWYYFNTPV